MNLIAPFGFYGWGNIGDESTLQGFAQLMSRYHTGTRVWVASRNPAHTERTEPRFRYFKAVGRDPWRRWARYRSQACVVPGGTPIMDVLGDWPLSELAPIIKTAHDQGKPVVFVGTGTEKLLTNESKRIIADVIAPSVLHWSVRCDRDRERLSEYGVTADRITVAADLAWMLDKEPVGFGKKYLESIGVDLNNSLVGVNVNNERVVLEKEPRLFEKLGLFLDSLVEKHDVRVLFLCNEVREDDSFDKAASKKVINFMNHQDRTLLVPNQYWSPQQMLSMIGCCCATVSTRYHFCLFSALQSVPFIGLKRSDKVDDLCWDLDWAYGVSLSAMDDSVMVAMFSEIFEQKPAISHFLSGRVQAMKQRVIKNTIPLNTLAAHIA